jgi:hypothetical protein
MSCGTTHKKAKAGVKKKVAKAPTKQTRKPLTLAQRKKISAALQCYNAAHGTCKKKKRGKAQHHTVAWYKKHGYHKVTTCKAVVNGYSRSVTVTPRNTAHLRRMLWHEIHHAWRIDRKNETAYLVHMGFRKEKVALHGHRAAAAQKKARPRNHHINRVSCHSAWRKTTSTAKPRVSQACPKRKSRLAGGGGSGGGRR